MKNDKDETPKRGVFKHIRPSLQWLRPRGLQADMTISYVWVTVAAVLVLEILVLAINGFGGPGPNGLSIGQVTGLLIRLGLYPLVIAAPIGALFGLITTRSLVRRLHNLVLATTRFANGDYAQRLQVRRPDEVGQLEQQFNRMA